MEPAVEPKLENDENNARRRFLKGVGAVGLFKILVRIAPKAVRMTRDMWRGRYLRPALRGLSGKFR